MFSLGFGGVGVDLIVITFSVKKGKNLARQTSFKDSMTMNPGKSAASFFEYVSDKFLFVFLLEDTIRDIYFSLVLRSTTNY